ncbi:hypothetical protein [Streptomyces sp. HB2AG]|uniref:hypothetical protein n=1 Tax=Streptomyces sp. HB2AG TaxID=2983400 RepID=UPI0022AA914F|nr:hypothetical protein [Streptomyces sp. HB2AG]MCZ2526060.1 hypothetical protein [Streptomyces sp. HB2AG]
MVALSVLLLWAFWALGRGEKAWVTGKSTWAWETLGNAAARVFGGAAAMGATKSGPTAGSRLACLVLLLLVLWALRNAMLRHKAHKPGPVEVQELVNAVPGSGSEHLTKDLTARLRKHLSETDLYPPSTLPAEPPAESFLDLLGGFSPAPAKLGAGLTSLLGRLRPKVAYRVGGVLRTRDRAPACGITVTVTSFGTRGSRTETLWGKDWEEAVTNAGYWVMATLLPVTRPGRKPPWQAWRGRNLPHTLFAAYQEGQKLNQERRFDEALARFYEAVRQDPTNLYLRTQVATVQEKMGLALDALETYHGALTLGGLSTEQENKHLWAAPYPLWRRFAYVRSWRGHPGFLQARYRYAVVLGTAERTAYQWCKDDAEQHPARARARREIRETLTPVFTERYWQALVPPHRRSRRGEKERAEGVLKNLLPEPEGLLKKEADALRGRRVAAVRLVFQLACMQEVTRLCQHYPVARLLGATKFDVAITRGARRINRDVWAPLRLAWAKDVYDRTGGPAPRWKEFPEFCRGLDWRLRAGPGDVCRDAWRAVKAVRAEHEEQQRLWGKVREDFARLGTAVVAGMFRDTWRALTGVRASPVEQRETWDSVAADFRHVFGVRWPRRTIDWRADGLRSGKEQRDERGVGRGTGSGKGLDSLFLKPRNVIPDDVRDRVRKARMLIVLEKHSEWQDHYNAACAYAVAMCARERTEGLFPEDDRTSEFAELAVHELERSVHEAESGFLFLKRPWILAEDPDLEPLRQLAPQGVAGRRFVRFAREAYPHLHPSHPPAGDVPAKIEMTAYDRSLLMDLASLMEATWRRRSLNGAGGLLELIGWFEDEEAVWQSVHRIAKSQARNWPDRVDLLRKVREAADPTALAEVEVHTAVQECDEILDSDEYRDGHGDYRHDGHGHGARRTPVRLLDDSLDRLSRYVTPEDPFSPLNRSRRWAVGLRSADALGEDAFPQDAVCTVCLRYAAAWAGLRCVLLDPETTVLEPSLHSIPEPGRLVLR